MLNDVPVIIEGKTVTKNVSPDEMMLIVSGPHSLQTFPMTNTIYSVLVGDAVCLVDQSWLLEATRRV